MGACRHDGDADDAALWWFGMFASAIKASTFNAAGRNAAPDNRGGLYASWAERNA